MADKKPIPSTDPMDRLGEIFQAKKNIKRRIEKIDERTEKWRARQLTKAKAELDALEAEQKTIREKL